MNADGPDAGAHDELIDVLVRNAFLMMAVLNTVAADNDLSLTQLRAMAILRDRRVRMSTLAAYLGLDKSTMSGLVDRAERRGLLQRAPSPDDGRAVEVFLGEAGVDLAKTLSSTIVETMAPKTERLSAAERTRLQSLLQRLIGP